VLFTPTSVPSPCPLEAPCTPLDIDLGYTINVPCFYHSLFLTPFVARDIKYLETNILTPDNKLFSTKEERKNKRTSAKLYSLS